jgi:nucleoid-associated protein YgaU
VGRHPAKARDCAPAEAQFENSKELIMAKHPVKSGDTLWRLAQKFYGDGRRYLVIAVANGITDPDHLVVGQVLEIPYVTFRHQVRPGEKKVDIALTYYSDVAMSQVYEVPSGVAQRDLISGEWLLIPDIANVGHHTVVAGETLQLLAERWYGDQGLDVVIALPNHLPDPNPAPGTVLMRPRLNRRYSVKHGDTLWNLAQDNYGDGGDERTRTMVALIAAANLIDNPDYITVGQQIHFPSFEPN